MSDSGDKTRRDGARGPLPRTNRPRPEPQRRAPAEARADTPEPTSGVPVEPPKVTPPPASSVPAEVPAISARVTARSVDIVPAEAAPPTERNPIKREDPFAAFVPEDAERPTQLDTGRTAALAAATGGGLKQVPLLRADGTPAVAAADGVPASTYVGCVIDGRYRIEGVLGRGGMGVVYRARHEIIDKLFAVKILLPTEDTEVVERFVNEARAATAIGNAHIVDTVDFGELPDGSTYFVMEYLEGQTLARRIKTDGFVSVSRTIAVGKQIAEGMEAAHRAGIVHRDLKPENIFLIRRDEHDDFVKLLDFGIAKIESTQNRITRAGTIFGTPHYMSPEQASGTEVDARTDIYAVGVILYEMVSGKVPFDAENPMGLITQHLYTEPVPLGRLPSPPQPIPSSVDAIVLKCLAKKADDRYSSMADFAEDLDRVYRGEPPDALADFLARAERDDDQELLEAARAELEPRTSTRWGRWLIWGVVTAGILALGAAVVRSLIYGSGIRESGAERNSSIPAGPSAAPAAPGERAIALVFAPIDGEVFRDGRTLGGMPVTVRLLPNETATVEIRREGFYAQTVKIDGSRPVVVVRLLPIPGVEPRIPVPTGEPLEALRRSKDDNMRSLAAFLYGHRDAGVAVVHRFDAGTRTTPRPAPPPNVTPPPPDPPGVSPPSPPTPAPPPGPALPATPAPPPPLEPSPGAATPLGSPDPRAASSALQ